MTRRSRPIADLGSGAARIEEEVVVTKDGCRIITNFPSDRLISCGLPGCEVLLAYPGDNR
jgi:hypothetical protein